MTESSERRRNLLICLGLVVVTAAVYLPVSHFGFINYDDGLYVTGNPHVQNGLTLRGIVWAFTSRHYDNWMPLTWLSCMLDCQLFGLNAGAHHAVNALFHIASALLLFSVFNRMTTMPWRSALVAALFALHPLHVESVAWVAERKDVLCGLFWMLTLWAYGRYAEGLRGHGSEACPPPAGSPITDHRSPSTAFYGLALLFFALGLMAKPMAVTLPLVLLLLDYWPLGRTRWTRSAASGTVPVSLRQLLMEKLPFLVLSAVMCGVTLWAQQGGGAVVTLDALPIAIRAANAVISYVRYIGQAFWPTGLAVFYPGRMWSVMQVTGAGAVLVAISGGVMWRATSRPQYVVGWLWFLGTLVPVIGLIQVGSQSMADRYTYLPLIGLFIMAAWSVSGDVVKQPAAKGLAAVTAAALLVGCAVLSSLQVRHWKNSETLFRHALSVTTDNALAHSNLGLELAGQGRIAEAITEYQAALQIRPEDAVTHNNLGTALVSQGKVAEAIAEYQAAVRIKSDSVEPHYNLGLELARQGKVAEAITEYREALRIKPDHAEAHYHLGIALGRQGKVAEAIAEYHAALQIRPDYVEPHNDLGVALAGEGRVAEAIAEFAAALQIKPDYAGAHNNLGIALAGQGKVSEAIAEYVAALRIEPDFADAHNNLGNALVRLGRASEATGHYEEALRINPEDVKVHNNLGTALLQLGRAQEALAQYREAVRLRPDWPPALSRLAWILATHGNDSLRNAVEAVQLAERLCRLTSYQQADALMVLAAAYAEADRFAEAVQTAQQAVELARASGPQGLAVRIEAQLKLYQEGRPCRGGSAELPQIDGRLPR